MAPELKRSSRKREITDLIEISTKQKKKINSVLSEAKSVICWYTSWVTTLTLPETINREWLDKRVSESSQLLVTVTVFRNIYPAYSRIYLFALFIFSPSMLQLSTKSYRLRRRIQRKKLCRGVNPINPWPTWLWCPSFWAFGNANCIFVLRPPGPLWSGVIKLYRVK